MADKFGTIVIAPRGGEQAVPNVSRGKLALDAALSTSNTYTFRGLLPRSVINVLSATIVSDVELDTNATPTLNISLGTSDDADGFIKGQAGAFNAGTPIVGNGALIGTEIKNAQDVVMTVAANPATGATTGNIFVEIWYQTAGL